jgi:hypothetical protein
MDSAFRKLLNDSQAHMMRRDQPYEANNVLSDNIRVSINDEILNYSNRINTKIFFYSYRLNSFLTAKTQRVNLFHLLKKLIKYYKL